MKEYTRKTLKIYAQKVWRYKLSVLFTLVAVALGALLNVVVPLYFKKFFDLLASGEAKLLAVKSLLSLLSVIAAWRLAQWTFWRVATFCASYFQSKTMTDLTNYCFAYLHQHSFSFFNDNFVGSLVKKVKWFGRSFESISDRILWDLLPLFVNSLAIIIVLLYRNLWLGAGVVAWIILFLAINTIFIRYKLKYDLQRSRAETEATGFLADSITNHSTVKLFDGYHREIKAFQVINEKLRRLRKFTWDLGSFFEAVQGMLMTILEIGILYVAIKLWQRGILTIGDFVLIQAYLVDIIVRIWDFGKVVRSIYESLADADEMTEVLETPLEIKDVHCAKDLQVKAGAINFQKVMFCYRSTREIFKGFNLNIRARERVAIVGPSGAGKTTLIKMLLRMHEVASGSIFIDGQDIARVTQKSLRQAISLVPQEPILFHRSLADNIRYGKPNATKAEVSEAAKAAHCHEFIVNLPDGYDTFVGERGIKLSSGERQRVAIARAILYNAPILVLDEATSSLDSESELLIRAALDKLMSGKTVIAIAHRLSTIKKMDRIIVIDKGVVVEEGTHDGLIRHRGIYWNLWQLQAGGFLQ